MLNIIISLTLLTTNLNAESLLISKIHFNGNKTFSQKHLKKLLSTKEKTPFYQIELERDIRNLKEFYSAQGFKYVAINSDIKSGNKGKEIYFTITERERIKISSINIISNNAFPSTKIFSLFKLKKGNFLIASNIVEAEKSIVRWYKNNGYPFVTIETNIATNYNYATVTFNITEGQKAFIKNLKIRGNKKISNSIILRTTEIKIGEKFSLEKLEKARQRLYATKLFERVAFYILDTLTKDSLTIRFDVLELPPHSIGFGCGVQTPPTGFIVSTEWEHLNFLSRGHNITLSGEYANNFTRDWFGEIKSVYRIFYLFSTPISFAFEPSFKYEKVDSIKQNRFNVETGISRYIGPKLELGTFLRYLRIWSDYRIQMSSNHKSITNSQNIYIRFDSRDNIFVPQQGIFFTANLQIAGNFLNGDNDFYKNQTELSIFYKIFQPIILGTRIMTGIAIPYGRDTIVPYFETFGLGGNNGLRGYDDKSIGPTIISNKFHYGEAVMNINFELRTRLEKLIDFVGFFDFGKVTEQKDFIKFTPEMLNYSTGLGIRINTPFGPLRADYAKRLKSPLANDWGKIHIGLLNIF